MKCEKKEKDGAPSPSSSWSLSNVNAAVDPVVVVVVVFVFVFVAVIFATGVLAEPSLRRPRLRRFYGFRHWRKWKSGHAGVVAAEQKENIGKSERLTCCCAPDSHSRFARPWLLGSRQIAKANRKRSGNYVKKEKKG
jgi:hypothetical protein